MSTFIALIRLFAYLLRAQPQKRACIKLGKQGKIQERDELVNKLVLDWAKYMITLVGGKDTNLEIIGKENIPQNGASVFISNHQGYMDIPVMMVSAGIPVGFISKVEVLKVPLLSDWMKLMQCVFLNRTSPHQSIEAINKGVENVKAGYSMVIFPEGHRSKGKPMQEFRPGSFKLAFRSEVPIVPVTIEGTWHLFEEKKKPQSANIKITFHKPIPTAGLSKQEQALIPEQAKAIIRSALDENLPC